MEDKDKEKARESFKDILDSMDDNNLPIEQPGDSDLPARMDHEPMDYDRTKSVAVTKGKKLMDSLLKLYLSQEVIENNEYIKLKAQIDTMTLSSLINQMHMAEHALTTLMRTIDSGELHPRMFEVLGGLQKTMLDIMKHQTLHLHAMEEGAKKLKHDIDIYGDNTIQVASEDKKQKSSGDNVNRGTRSLMRDLQQEITDTEFEEDNEE